MKTLVAIADSHGNVSAVEKLRPLLNESDYIIHLGDGARDMKNFYQDFGNKIYQVDGNCDIGGYNLKYFTFDIEKVRVLITHGDNFGVKFGLGRLVEFAKQENCNLVLYGHTHEASIQTIDGILVVNPGSLSYFTAQKSVAYVVINGEKVVAKINYSIVKN